MSKHQGEIIGSSPVFEVEGTCPFRFIIRDLGGEYAVHCQIMQRQDEPQPKPSYHTGNYFAKRTDRQKALRAAWCCFDRRVRFALRVGQDD